MVLPVTAREKVYVFAVGLLLPGTVTFCVTAPLVQGTVAGRPERAGLEEKTQLVALVTWAERPTDPPEAPREVGAAAKDDTVGFAGVAWDTDGAITTTAAVRARANRAPREGTAPNLVLVLGLTEMRPLARRFNRHCELHA